MELIKLLNEIKRIYGVDLNDLRNEESRNNDLTLRRKRKFKNSFYIPRKTFGSIYRGGRVLNPTIYRIIDKYFTTESNGGYGDILTPKAI